MAARDADSHGAARANHGQLCKILSSKLIPHYVESLCKRQKGYEKQKNEGFTVNVATDFRVWSDLGYLGFKNVTSI